MAGLWVADNLAYYTRVNRRRLVRTVTPAVALATLTLDLPTFTAALAAEARTDAVLAGTLPEVTAALSAEERADAVLSATFPETQASLTAQALSEGQLVLDLPGITATLAAQGISGGNLDLVLPQATASLIAEVRADATLDATLPETQALLAASADTGGAFLLWVLPEFTASFAGTVEAAATLNGQLPQFQMNGQAEVIAEATLDLQLPVVEADWTGIAQALGTGQLNLALSEIIFHTGKGKLMREEDRQREVTRKFIEAQPTFIALTPVNVVRTASGASKIQEGVKRPTQMFRLIPMTSNERPYRNSSGPDQGVMSSYDFTLLGEWGAVVEPGDWWQDFNGQRWVVDSLVNGNGYETKAMITSYGKKP